MILRSLIRIFLCTITFLAITPIMKANLPAFTRYKQERKKNCITLEIINAAIAELIEKQKENSREFHDFCVETNKNGWTEEDNEEKEIFHKIDQRLKEKYRELQAEKENYFRLQKSPNKKSFIETWLDESSPSREGSQESYDGLSDTE